MTRLMAVTGRVGVQCRKAVDESGREEEFERAVHGHWRGAVADRLQFIEQFVRANGIRYGDRRVRTLPVAAG